MTVQIKQDLRANYRKPGTPTAGIVRSVSPTGDVARITFDHLQDSFVLVDHLEAVDLATLMEPLESISTS